MKTIPRISDAEWEVMKALWSHSPQTSAELVEALSGQTSWKPNTVRTLLARLVQKGAVHMEKDGREHRYSASLSEAQCTRYERKSFLQRVYNGAMLPMLVGMLEEEKLKPSEIAELRRVLDRLERKKRA